MNIALAILTGIILGYLIERGDLCFHSTLRGLVNRLWELDLFRAYLLIILIAAPLIWLLRATQIIDPWIPPFAWQANLIGGFIFGLGMVIAATCVTGLFYKLGHGMLGTIVGLGTWAIGDTVTYRGFLSPLRQTLNDNPVIIDGQAATLTNSFGAFSVIIVLVSGIGIAVWLWRSPKSDRKPYWSWPLLGISLGIFTAVAWVLAQIGGSNYTFGTSGVPSGAIAALSGEGAGGSLWIPLTLVSLIPGAFIAAWHSGTLWIRGESGLRYGQLAAGGLLMGIGAGLAGGCNLGHGLVGVPLLSLGSITTIIAMILGVWVADRVVRLWAASRQPAVVTEGVG